MTRIMHVDPSFFLCVCVWVLEGRPLKGLLSISFTAPRISSGKPLIDDPDKSLPQPASSSHTSHIVNHGRLPNSFADETSLPENLEPVKSGGVTSEVSTCASLSQDISQISGPDGISKATPLSQIGFRDSASVGGMQQLTLLSVEVFIKLSLLFIEIPSILFILCNGTWIFFSLFFAWTLNIFSSGNSVGPDSLLF